MLQTLASIRLFFIIAGCWLTLTNAEPYGASNFVSTSSSSFGTGAVGATGAINSFSGFSQHQIDRQLSGLGTGDMISINNVRYMALRSENDPDHRDTIILVQVAGQSDSYSEAISHLKGGAAFDESTVATDQSYSAPSASRDKIIDVGVPSAPYSTAGINRQEENAVVVNGGAGVNDPSSIYSSSSTSNRQSSTGRDHSSSAAVSAGKIRPNQNNGRDEEDYSNSIPGVAGQHYPILATVGATSFSCSGRKEGGYYADVESSCQVYHICALKRKFSFLCPNGTIFDQRVFVCNWWYNVDCASSSNYYNLNDLIGISPPTKSIENSINFSSFGSAPTKFVAQQPIGLQKPLKQIYGSPPVLIEQRPSSGLISAPLIQAVASSAY